MRPQGRGSETELEKEVSTAAGARVQGQGRPRSCSPGPDWGGWWCYSWSESDSALDLGVNHITQA